jgi:PAS domain S-box-containing protein
MQKTQSHLRNTRFFVDARAWPTLIKAAGLALAVACAYFLAARLSLALLTPSDGVAVFWPAAGISSGLLIALGPTSRLPVAVGVMIATIAANLLGDRNLASAAVFALCNAGEAMLLAWLIERSFDREFRLDTVRHVLGFFLATGLAVAVSGLGGTFGFVLFHSSDVPILTTWLNWFASDSIGIIALAPLLIGCIRSLHDQPNFQQLVEGLLVLAVVAVAGTVGFSFSTEHWFTILPLALLLPLLIWPAARYPVVFTAAAASILALIIVCTITFGVGRLGDPSVPLFNRVYAAQVAVLGISACALVLSALFEEGRRYDETLKEANDRMELALSGAGLGAFDLDLHSGRLQCDARAAFLHGHCELPRTTREGRQFIHRDDLRRVDAAFADAVRTSGIWNTEYRVTYPPNHPQAGEVRWLALDGSIVPAQTGKPARMLGVARDITEHKYAEQTLSNQEAAFRRLLEALPAAIHTTDRDGCITFCNKAAIDLWGARPEPGKDKCSDLAALYLPDGSLMPIDQCPTKACLTAGRAIEGKEAILERRDGTRIPIVPYPAPLTDEGGRVVGVVSLKVDITERKRAEVALAERDAQLALAGRAGLVGCFAYDTDTEIMRITQGYAAVHGLPEGTSEIARSRCLKSAHPEDIERIEHRRKDAFCKGLREYGVEYRVLRPDGQTRWVETRCFVSYDSKECARRVVGATIDITERKRTETALAERNAQFALASNAALVGCHTYDYIMGITTFPPGTAVIYGLPEETVELTRDEGRALVHPDDVGRLEEEHQQAVERRRREFVSEFRIVRANDCQTRWIETRNAVAYDDAGHPLRMTGVSIDVSERKQSENHQALLIAELDHRVKNVLACVTAIAHHASLGTRTTDEFLPALGGRIQSLANAHALLSNSRWQGVDLTELVRTVLAPCGNGGNTVIEGPDLGLAPDAAQAMAMALHELATNAAKYGALSNRIGQVSVRWRRQSNGGELPGLVLEWRETGGPPVGPASVSGYGTSVIRDIIPYELGGSVDYVHAPNGVRCRLRVPAKWLTNTTSQQGSCGTRLSSKLVAG